MVPINEDEGDAPKEPRQGDAKIQIHVESVETGETVETVEPNAPRHEKHR
jgi:hypothetical protein